MSFNIFFDDPQIQLPLVRGKEDFLEYIKSLIDHYRQILPQLNFMDPSLPPKGCVLCDANRCSGLQRFLLSDLSVMQIKANGHDRINMITLLQAH